MCRIICLTLAASCLLALGIFWSLSMFTTDGLPNAAVTPEELITPYEPEKLEIATGIPAKPEVPARLEPGQPPVIPTADLANVDFSSLVKGNIQFALDLYNHLGKKDGNVFFSPFSISSALAMAFAGARGKTADQMATILHFKTNPTTFNQAFGSLFFYLQKENKEYSFGTKDFNRPKEQREKEKAQISIANAFWGQKGFPFQKEYCRMIQAFYGGTLEEVDFFSNPEGSRKIINFWVKEKTRDKIPDLLGPRDVTPSTRLVLTNTIYFQAAWAKPFSKDLTKGERFYLSSGEPLLVQMMHKEEPMHYFETEEFQMVQLSYVDLRSSMILLVPRNVDGLFNIENSLTSGKFLDWQKKLRTRGELIQLDMPKIKIPTSYYLANTLIEMGMTLAFSEKADFSGICRHSLSLKEFIHKASLEVSEEGTEAAAATAITFIYPAMDVRISGSIPIRIRVDRPFLFLILDNETKTILFLGRIEDPR